MPASPSAPVIPAARLQTLVDHGLTDYEARAYLALLDLGSASARSVAHLAHVPRTKIYPALEGLAAKRLVTVLAEKPKRYAAEPFAEYIDEMMGTFEDRAATLRATRDALAQQFLPRASAEPDRGRAFVSLRGRSRISRAVAGLAESVERTLVVTTTANGLDRLAYAAPQLGEAAARGVAVVAQAPLTAANAEAARALRDVGVDVQEARVDLGAATIAVADERVVLLVHHVPDDRHLFVGADVALRTDDSGAVRALAALLALARAPPAPGAVAGDEADASV